MSTFVITLLLVLGSCTWLFTKLQNRSGRNTQQSVIATVAAGTFLFILVWSVLTLF